MAESSGASLRPPKPQYWSQNGFVNHIPGPSSSINLHAVAANPSGASKEEMRELRNAVQRRQFVEDMMELKGTYFPGLDAIKQANEAVDTSTTLKDRIQEIQKKHVEEVRTLYQWQAQDYYDEMLDMSRNRGDIDDRQIDDLYQCARVGYDMATSFDDAFNRHRYAYINVVQPLIKQRVALRRQEDLEQMRRDQQFVSSIAEFRAIRNKDVQLRIARFLTADETTRERTMDEFKWTYRQVRPLVTEYDGNDEFKGEIQTLLREVEVRDPRKPRP